MLSTNRLLKSLFFDLESAGQYASYAEFLEKDPVGAEIFKRKAEKSAESKTPGWDPEDLETTYLKKAPLHAEFGRIVCLSYGIWKNGEMVIATISDPDEEVILKKAANLFIKCHSQGYQPVGWNIKGFDCPWLFKKFLKYKIPVPEQLNTFGKKPWDVEVLDLMDLWKGTSTIPATFEDAVYMLGIPTPKDAIGGKDVHKYFWAGKTADVIIYCEKDVKALIQIAEYIHDIYA